METKRIEIKKNAVGGLNITCDGVTISQIQDCVDKFKAVNAKRAVFTIPESGAITATIDYSDPEPQK
ncbi:MAG: hypothetical protein V4547_18135 [Bacteroidota bacterium]